jgi:iron-sulfur cluster assembly protein
MIKITPAAAEQIKLSAQQGGTDGMALRIAATRNADNTIHYGMGFDEHKNEDTVISSQGIEIVISMVSAELLKDTTLDYVELEQGEFQFIFMNPNDPEYTPPAE